MDLHTHLMKRWLSVKENIIAIYQVSIYRVTYFHLHRRSVQDTQRYHPAALFLDGFRTRIRMIPGTHNLRHPCSIHWINLHWNGNPLCYVLGNTQLENSDVWIRCNHRTSGIIHTFSHQISTNPPILVFNSLLNRLKGSTRSLLGRRESGNLVVYQRSNVILKKLIPVIDHF